MTKITIAAVGDLLMKSELIASARQSGKFNFDPIFEKVAPTLKKFDLTIGNLETTFSGKRWHEEGLLKREKCNCPREKRSQLTGYPIFSCPDELAPALKNAGFNVLITANNHCMDGGTAGVARTLDILDKQGIKHAGTNRSLRESNQHLIVHVKGVAIGILAYTRGTNSLPVPKPWLVNRMDREKMIADIRALRSKTDFIIVYLHFGQEYRTTPDKNQKQWMQLLLKHGANAVLGSHPHVKHPVALVRIRDRYGRVRNRVAASSLGNFLSTRLKRNSNTLRGTLLAMTLTKDARGKTDISNIERIPTIVKSTKEEDRTSYQIVPEQQVRQSAQSSEAIPPNQISEQISEMDNLVCHVHVQTEE